METATKIWLILLILAVLLFISGCRSAWHPKLVVAGASEGSAGKGPYIELVTSKASRAFGIARMAGGAGLGVYLVLPFLKRRKH